MRKKKRKAALTLVLCLLALAASIALAIFITRTRSGSQADSAPSSSAAASQPDSMVVESEPEPTPEPTQEPVPEPTAPVFPDVAQQPDVVYPEGGQPTFTVSAADGLRMRSGPGTDFDRLGAVPTGTQLTALGTDAADSWILVQYNGTYGWLTKQFLTAN